MPVIVRDLDDDAATIIMVDSNLQRESLLPSERAFAYKMKLEAMKHQGARGGLNFVPNLGRSCVQMNCWRSRLVRVGTRCSAISA